MIEIIKGNIEMPPLDERRYQKSPIDCNGNKWLVTDTQENKIRYKGNFVMAALACYNLNKKHYLTTVKTTSKK